MRVCVTGANGFLGGHVVQKLLNEQMVTQIIASDLTPSDMTHPKLVQLNCDLTSRALRDAAAGCDTIIHLAATLGASAEQDPQAARRINVDATLDLMTACQPNTRFVFASTLAVLGATSNQRAPVMVYGAHKSMVEIAIETATRRGELDGISLRPGGIVARKGVNTALKSAFLSRLFHAVAEGSDITLPVCEDGCTWLSSVQTVATQFVQAACCDALPAQRSMTLPMMPVRFGDLIDALRAAYPDSASCVTFSPEDEAMALFGTAHPLDFEAGLAAGFKPDADLRALVRASLETGER